MPRNKRLNYPATKARQGEIVLRQPWERVVFIAGLVGCVLAAVAAALFWQ